MLPHIINNGGNLCFILSVCYYSVINFLGQAPNKSIVTLPNADSHFIIKHWSHPDFLSPWFNCIIYFCFGVNDAFVLAFLVVKPSPLRWYYKICLLTPTALFSCHLISTYCLNIAWCFNVVWCYLWSNIMHFFTSHFIFPFCLSWFADNQNILQHSVMIYLIVKIFPLFLLLLQLTSLMLEPCFMSNRFV